MDMENIKSNKAGIIISVLALLIAGAVIIAQTDRNPNNDITAIFQKKVTLPAGAQVSATLRSSVSSQSSNVGDIVAASVSSPVTIENDLLIPTGSILNGRVAYLERAVKEGQLKNGAIGLSFDRVQLPDGKQYPLIGSVPISRAGYTSKTVTTTVRRTRGEKFRKGLASTAVGAAGGALFGTAIGAIAGGMPGRGAWSGTAIGGGLGAAKGIYDAARDRGRVVTTQAQAAQDITLNSGQPILITVERPVQLIAQKYDNYQFRP